MNLKSTDIDGWLDRVLGEHDIPEGIECIRELRCGIETPIDCEQLRRAVLNVVTNAIHALRDEASQGNQLTVGTHVVGDRLEIRVSDTGCGIPADVIDKIFEPLFSTKSFGIGLGMPIVKDIMKNHGGGVEIQSKIGKGTVVTLWLPTRISHQITGYNREFTT
jgi:signal transduction histidine kinase